MIGQRLFAAFTAISYKRTDNSAVGGAVAGQEDVSGVRDRDADELVRAQLRFFDKEPGELLHIFRVEEHYLQIHRRATKLPHNALDGTVHSKVQVQNALPPPNQMLV